MTIGEKIKSLRKKYDFTQEKLSDYLNVSYQAVSKWECGLSSPDISLIGPLTKLFDVTADELLGLSSQEKDERKQYFDSECFMHWNKEDHLADYEIAKQAVAEYPNNFQYIMWLANNEYYIAFNDDYRNGGSLDYFNEMMESSIKHYLMIVEDCYDEELKRSALYSLVLCYKFSNRLENARKYAEMIPEKTSITRDDALEQCLNGEELLTHRQKMLGDSLQTILHILQSMWNFADSNDKYAKEALKSSISIINSIFSDENTLNFSWYLMHIHRKLAEISVLNNELESAIDELRLYKKYSIIHDEVMNGGKQYYTSLLLDHNYVDYSELRSYGSNVEFFYEELKRSIYDKLRDFSDFKEL